MTKKLFRDMTEEEKVEWAKTYVQPVRSRPGDAVQIQHKKKRARRKAIDKARVAKYYSDAETKERIWGAHYNERLRYLYTYNEDYRNLHSSRAAFSNFRSRRLQYQAWIIRYYQKYKGKMPELAQTYRLPDSENFVLGFTEKDMVKYSPIGTKLFEILRKENIIPPPKYHGYRFKAKKIGGELEPFYLVSECEAYLNVWARYKKKFGNVTTEQQKAWLTKEFWSVIQEARKEFDE
jgi:hypothetical protein